MSEDQLAVNRNAITLQGGTLDLDVLIPDINWSSAIFRLPRGFTYTSAGTLTLRTELQNPRATTSHAKRMSPFKQRRISNSTWMIQATGLTLVPLMA